MPTPYFSIAQIQELFQALVAANHVEDGVWRSALALLPALYRSQLPQENSSPALFKALATMNHTSRLVDGSIPIEVVLGNLRILSSDATVTDLAARLIAQLQGQAGLGRAGGVAVAYAAPQPEAYTGTGDETLPYDFLRRGDELGRSVVKLVVPRFENGVPALGPAGVQRRYRGTGWLIAPDLLITNLHVVSARETDEHDPLPGDLDLQIKATEVQFGFDYEGAEPTKTTVSEGVALGQRGGARDYALLRVVKLPSWPAPLGLRRQPPSIPPEGFAVNIIQHPAGMAKRVAARSNLLRPTAAAGAELQYFSDTLGGSSGSPLCNDAWEVIGLHRASGPASNVIVKGKEASTYNIGIPIDSILRDVEQNQPDVFAEIKPTILA